MKRALLTVALLLPLAAQAQQGTITYTEAVRLEIELPPEMEAQMRDQIPNSMTATKVLHFSESGSLMKNAPKAEDEDGGVTMGGDGMMIRMMGPGDQDNQVFSDFENGVLVEKREFLGRTFLITGEPETWEWRLTGEQSEFLGFACMKAIAEQDSSVVEAWFTPEIPISGGPGLYGGLPGMILVVNVDDGERTYTATDVSLAELADGTLAPPEDGRKVSREEFDAIVEEKMEEMGGERRGRRGNVHIRIAN